MVAAIIFNLPIKPTVTLTGRPTKRKKREKINNVISVLPRFLDLPEYKSPKTASEHIIGVTLRHTYFLKEPDGQV